MNQEKIRHSQEQNKPSGQTDSSESILLCYFLLLLCLTWGAVLWQSEQDRRSTENQIVSINDNLAQAYEDHTQNALIRVEKVLAFLKADYETHGAVTPSVHLLVKQQIDDPLINQSVVTDAVGNLLTSALGIQQNLANAPQFRAHIQRDTGRFFIGQPRVGRISGKESVHVSRRLNNPDGSFAGMVSVALNPQYFTGFYQSMRLSEGYSVCLFGLDGVIRARYPADATFNPQLLFAALERQPAGHYREGNIFYSYRRLPSHPLGVLVGVSGDSALAAYRQRRTTYYGGAIGVSLLMIGFTALRLRSLKQKRMLQARYRALMEQSFDALVLVEMKTQQVVEVNPKFSELFGYSLPADAPLYVNQFLVDTQSNLDHLYNVTLPQQRHLPPESRLFRHKRGMLLYVERVGSVINVDGKDIFLASMRDMTAERRRQAALSRDVEFARTVQRELLPSVESSDSVEIRTLYYPMNFVNGDAYHLEWQQQGTLLRGFLIDVSGHGMATALQTTALSVLLRETAANGLSLLEQIQHLNRQSAKYFSDDSYAAILAFELDLQLRQLRYVGAGITQFYANGVKIETPGMFVGMWDDAEFFSGSLPVTVGDRFFFLTDGFTDALAKTGEAFDAAMLERLGESGELGDDATGVFLRIV